MGDHLIVITISLLLATLIIFLIEANKKYYSKTEIEKRKMMKTVEFNSRIHRECDECAGHGIDFIAGPCFECDGRGFVEMSNNNSG